MWTTICTVVLMSALCMARPQQPTDERGRPLFWDSAYQFAYAVASPEYGDYHGHQQSMDEYGHTSGSYYLLGADGQWSQTIYADKGLGYQTVYNQRPAGAPPPQVSEVTYQIFVHPGATAISAQGGGAPPAPLEPFGGIRQDSLVDPNLVQQQQAQQGRRLSRESSSQLLPIGDPTIDAAFTPYYESQNIQQRNAKSVQTPRLSREAEPETLYYISEPDAVPEPGPRVGREVDLEYDYFIEEEPIPEPLQESKIAGIPGAISLN